MQICGKMQMIFKNMNFFGSNTLCWGVIPIIKRPRVCEVFMFLVKVTLPMKPRFSTSPEAFSTNLHKYEWKLPNKVHFGQLFDAKRKSKSYQNDIYSKFELKTPLMTFFSIDQTDKCWTTPRTFRKQTREQFQLVTLGCLRFQGTSQPCLLFRVDSTKRNRWFDFSDCSPSKLPSVLILN